MFCCFGPFRPYGPEAKTPLLEESASDSVESLLKRLNLMIRVKRAQSDQYRVDALENRSRMKQSATQMDRTGSTHYCIEARKSDHYYAQALKQSSNLQDVYRTIHNAVVNLEIAKNLSASTLTLDELQKEMPTERLGEIMDTFRDRAFDVDQQSNILAQNDDFDLNQEDVDAEVAQLFAINLDLPNVPVSSPPREAGAMKQTLKTE